MKKLILITLIIGANVNTAVPSGYGNKLAHRMNRFWTALGLRKQPPVIIQTRNHEPLLSRYFESRTQLHYAQKNLAQIHQSKNRWRAFALAQAIAIGGLLGFWYVTKDETSTEKKAQ